MTVNGHFASQHFTLQL